MGTAQLASLSGTMLFIAFLFYLVAVFFFGATIRDKHTTSDEKREKPGIAGNIGIVLTILGFLSQVTYFVTRWMASGHAPISNMFEYSTFFSMTITLGFIIIYLIYKTPVLGVFALPITIIIIGYASMFPSEISPITASLQSYWLPIHVSTVSLGQGLLSISFIAGLIYLVRQINQSVRNKKTTSLEIILFVIMIFLGFSVISLIFKSVGYEATFQHIQDEKQMETTYYMPAIAGPYEGELLSENAMEPWFDIPSWMHGKDAGRKFNTIIWSTLTGAVLYGVIRLFTRKRLGAFLQPFMQKVKPELLDEISYRSIAIGFPVFTLGGLIFASIWAQIAWDRFWGWDPKEVWALITWFFYAAFLHLRLSRGWHGEKSAWLAVVGFAIIMFNLIAVNLLLAGLHSYAS